MKVKFNHFERVAGLFVLCAGLVLVVSMVGVSIKQGWFDSKVVYKTVFANADGIHPGTQVQISGLKAGSVESVDLLPDNKIMVTLKVLSKFEDKIKQDSVAQLIRPFIIGERLVDITVGSMEAPSVVREGFLTSKESLDLMTLISGKHMGDYLQTFSGAVGNLKMIAEAFLDPNRTKAFIDMFDRIEPLIRNLNTMSIEVIKLSKMATKDKNLEVVLGQLAVTTKELNTMLPQFQEQAPHMAKDLSALVTNLAILTQEFKVVLPALAEVAPDLPHASRRAVEALDEVVVLVKAMQKSFFVRGSAQEVREEEALRDKQREQMKNRLPATESAE